MREFHEIPRHSEGDEEETKNIDGDKIAAKRLKEWQRKKEEPEAELEAGKESESGKNDEDKENKERQSQFSADEIAAMRVQQSREDLQQANEIRKKLGIPTKEE